jgi:hypothetical protein
MQVFIAAFFGFPAASEPAIRFQPDFMPKYAVPTSLLSATASLFITENRRFHKFMIITMILTYPHDFAIR